MADDLRHRYASALDDLDHGHDQQERRYVFVDDALEAIMAVRDNELEQLKEDALAVVAESTQELQAWRERAETAEAAIARVRQLRDVFEVNSRTIDGVAGRNFFELFVEELDAALDDQESPTVAETEEET